MRWGRGAPAAALLLVAAQIALPPGAAAAEVRVSHANGRAVYLDGGRAEGLAVGDRIDVLREGRAVALLEVVHLTEHSAFCQLVHGFSEVAAGDLAFPSSLDEVTVTGSAEPLPPPETPANLPRLVERRRRESVVHLPSVTGSAFFRHQVRTTSVAGDGSQRQWQDSTARVSVRGRNLGGMPVSLRVRGRARTRQRDFGADPGGDQRIYELSVGYEPQDHRSWWQVGRLGSRQETGVGFLDGAAGQWGFGGNWGVGGFAGVDAEVDDDLFSSEGTKAGAFISWATPRGQRRYGEFLLSAIGEYAAGEVSREYVYLQSRVGRRGRWSIYQQAEVDFHRDWRAEVAEASSQLSNLSLSGSFEVSERVRMTLSYDLRRRFRDYETRDIPEERFDDLLREGARATLFYRGDGGLALSFGVGSRGGDGDVASLTSYTASASHGDLFGTRVFGGVDLSAFSGDQAEGYLVTVRARRGLGRGRDVGITLGDSRSSSLFSEQDLALRWVRVDGSVQLPRDLYLTLELEFGLGAESEDRQMLQLGYRF
ncbi:MAG: hypothetical protein DWQ36_25360 [Acidobacteria bacterium]|nr:MAG: hypothetical protein DWQ30_25375 [Acidobacteriota bacterium]REJ99487.1 MAG: hypothetical protein DWQ36_25360 [Acidobacteriota bacterium]